MGRNTGIQWCDDTANPTSGCDGCELFIKPPAGMTGDDLKEWLRKQPCYASHVHQNRLAHSFPDKYAKSFGEVRLIPGRLQKCTNWPDLTGKDRPEKPWMNGMPRLIFISDMSDALSEAVPFEYLLEEIIKPVIAWQKNRHIGLWLTKRPDRMARFAAWLVNERGIKWPKNLWAGTSVTTQPTANKRIPHLLHMKAAGIIPKAFVSFEPARALIDFMQVTDLSPYDCSADWLEYIDWIIVGGESGYDPRPFDIDIARGVVRQCFANKVAPFVKQLGALPVTNNVADFAKIAVSKDSTVATYREGNRKYYAGTVIHLKDSHGGDWNEWPADLRFREFPEVKP